LVGTVSTDDDDDDDEREEENEEENEEAEEEEEEDWGRGSAGVMERDRDGGGKRNVSPVFWDGEWMTSG